MALLQWMCLARIAKLLSSFQNHILRPASPYFFPFLPIVFYLLPSTIQSVSASFSYPYRREMTTKAYSENLKHKHVFGNPTLLEKLVVIIWYCCLGCCCFNSGHPASSFQYNWVISSRVDQDKVASSFRNCDSPRWSLTSFPKPRSD